MSAKTPGERFLGVPDLVENVFLRLDAASRRAFFQAHPDIAQNGLVLAHAHLRIELSPGSLEDQWQRVLRLTRSQPVCCLILAGPNKERLQEFLRCVPEGKHEEKQRVLQGTELQLQVYIKLGTGGVPEMKNLLRSWRDEQQAGVEGGRVQLVLDLCGCGHELTASTEGDLDIPGYCMLKNGTLQMTSNRVKVSGHRVHFGEIKIKGADKQEVCVEVASGGSLAMKGCPIEGGSKGEGELGGAVRVEGEGASLCAQRCDMRSSEGNGLVVYGGGNAALEHVTVSSCGLSGIRVDGDDSTVSAAHCCMEENGKCNVLVGGSGILVGVGSRACSQLRHCSMNGSTGASGCAVTGNRKLEVSNSTASGNTGCGFVAFGGATARLSACTAANNGATGLSAATPGSCLVAKSCHAFGNGRGNTGEFYNGRVICQE